MKENWVDQLVKQDYFSTVRRFTVAALLGVASVIPSAGALPIMGVVAPLISAGQHYFEKKRKQKMLVNFYEDELGTVLHKDPAALNFDDLGATSKQFNAIGRPLKAYEKTQNLSIGIAVVSTLVTVGLLMAATAIPGLTETSIPIFLQMGLVTAGYMMIRNTVSAVSHAIFRSDDDKKCVTEKLMELSDHLKETPINAVQIFSVFAEANPKLQQDVVRRFGKKFDDLSAIRKKDVVDAYEVDMRVNALTNALNHDEIKTSLVGFLAYNQGEGLPGFAKYKELFSAPLAKGPEVKMNEFPAVKKDVEYAKRLTAEREEMDVASRILN